MTALVNLLAALAAVLGLIAVVVFGLEDRGVLVPPPDAVAENFARQLAAHRYAQALPQLDEATARETGGAETLKAWTRRLEARTGPIEQVRGTPGSIAGDNAEARAVLTTRKAGEVTIPFGLTRREGVWSIDDLSDLKREALGEGTRQQTGRQIPGAEP